MMIAAIVSHHQAMRDVEQSRLPRWIRLNSWNLNSLDELIVRLLNRASEGLRLKGSHSEVAALTLSKLRENIRGSQKSM